MARDDYDVAFTMRPGEEVFDAKTRQGPWATMTRRSFDLHSTGILGLGRGQRYVRQANGELHLTEGGA